PADLGALPVAARPPGGGGAGDQAPPAGAGALPGGRRPLRRVATPDNRQEESNVALVDVLIPTYGRKTGLAVVLTSLLGQTFTDFDVIVSDQTPEDDVYLASVEIDTLVRALRWHGHRVTRHRHLPRRGMAEQRQFLLE